MEYSARYIASLIDGKIEGDPDVKITGFARIESGKKGTMCFYANPKYEKYVYTTQCDILIVNDTFVPSAPVHPTLIKVKDSYAAVAFLLDFVSRSRRPRRYRGGYCHIKFNAKLGRRVYVGDFTYVGSHAKVGSYTKLYEQVYVGDNVTIGKNCILYPGVKIYPGTVIGDNVILHAGVVVGSDGFGFAPLPDGSYRKIQHTGNVIIEDDVEIGANSTVDRSQIGSTIIHKGVKIDNLCQIAHNVEVGDNTVIAALSGVAGSAKLGKNCVIGGQSGIVGHIEIADRTTLAGHSGIISTVKEPGQTFMGYPALPYRMFLRCYALFKNAPNKK